MRRGQNIRIADQMKTAAKKAHFIRGYFIRFADQMKIVVKKAHFIRDGGLSGRENYWNETSMGGALIWSLYWKPLGIDCNCNM